MKEDEAKKKWCPMAREETVVLGRWDKEGKIGYCCIASNCMMWRWAGGNAERGIGNEQGYCGFGGPL